jgi:hypothetical protein
VLWQALNWDVEDRGVQARPVRDEVVFELRPESAPAVTIDIARVDLVEFLGEAHTGCGIVADAISSATSATSPTGDGAT